MRSIATRIGTALVVLILVSFGAAALVDLIPGSAADAILGDQASPEAVAAITKQLGLDKPLLSRYGTWVSDLFHGNLGTSTQSTSSVSSLILARLPVTIEIALGAIIISLVISFPVALLAAARSGKLFDRFVSGITSILLAVPSFVLALVLSYFLADRNHVLPSGGWSPISEGFGTNLRFAILPMITLAAGEAPVFIRVLRSDLLSTLREDFMVTAQARGLPPTYLMLRHALRPSLFSLMTVFGIAFGRLFGSTVIVETVFSLPGLGALIAQSIFAKDVAVIQAIVVLVALVYVVVNTAIDLLYGVVDPRVRGR